MSQEIIENAKNYLQEFSKGNYYVGQADMIRFINYIVNSNDIKGNAETLIQLIKDKQPLPENLLQLKTIKSYIYFDNLDINALDAWIIYRKNEQIPENFYYAPNLSPGYCNTQHLKYWIKYRQNEPIPEKLYFEGCNYSKTHFHDYLCWYWLLNRPTEMMPKQLTFPGWLKLSIDFLNQLEQDIRFDHKVNKEDIKPLQDNFVKIYFKPAYDKYLRFCDIDENCDWQCDFCDDNINGIYCFNNEFHCPKCCKYNYKYFDQIVANEVKVDYTAVEQFIYQ